MVNAQEEPFPNQPLTLVYAVQLANKGLMACHNNPGLQAVVNIQAGKVTNAAVAATFGLELTGW